MAKRNSGRRQGASAPDPTSPLATAADTNSVFSFVTPTEFVELPSKGQFYPSDHPLHGVDTIEIKHMTAKEEDILTSEALLRNGTALDRLLASVILNKQIRPDSLLIGDKNAVLIASRETGFGPWYSAALNCPSCNALNEQEFSLAEKTIESSVLPENVTLLENGNFLMDVNEYDLTVEIRLLTGADEGRITKILENRKKHKLSGATVTQMLQSIVAAVNGIEDAVVIQQFVDAVPASLSRKIRSTYDSVMPNIKIFGEFTCDNCSHSERMEVPMTVSFFWPEL